MSLAVQLQDAGNVVAICGIPLVLGEVMLYARGRANPVMEAAGYALFAAGDALNGIGSLMRAQWGSAAWSFALAMFFAWLAWKRWRRHRKRAAALLGAKSRALRDALVRKAREAAKPRPVLRPVPGAAR